MSKSQNTTAAQTLNLAVAQKQTEKIALQPGQAIKIMVDGQPYTGQKTINGRAVRMVRKGDKLILEVEGQDQALVEVSGFFPADSAAEQAATIEGVSADNLLGYLDPQGLFESGSSAQVAAADTVGAPAVSTPSWGTLIAQAASATTTTTTATAATAATAAAAISPGAVAAVLLGAAVVINNANSDDTPAEETQTIVSGTITAGPVIAGHNLTVTIYDNAGNTLASGIKVSSTGTFTADLGDYSGPIIAVLVNSGADEDYVDEKTAAPVDLSTSLLAVTTVTAGTSIKLNINPITTAAAIHAGVSLGEEGVLDVGEERTAEEFAADVSASNTAVAKALNLGTADNLLSDDVATTVDADGVTNLSDANAYGKALAIISAMDTTTDRTGTAAAINSLAAGINSDGSTSNDLAAALNTAATDVAVLSVNIQAASAAASVVEHVSNLDVYTVSHTASLEGATFSYALSGADAALFNVSSEGVVSFKAAPDHEAAADAGADNVYNLTLTVTATQTDPGTGLTQTSTDSIALAITVTDVADVGPVFTSGATATVAENTSEETTVYTAAATPDVSGDTVTYSLGDGSGDPMISQFSADDSSYFNIDQDGNVTFISSPDFDYPYDSNYDNVYNITVTATAGGVSSTQNVTITVTNVNEAPTLSGVPSTTTTAVVGQALALADFAVADVDSATVTVTLTATNGTIGGVQDADANTAGIQVTGTASAVNTALAGATFTAAGAGSASVGIAVTDGSLNASGTYSLNAVTAPSLSTTLGGVNNLDARSNIVLTASENVTAVAGKFITITNTGGTGFHGESTVNSFQIAVTDTSQVTISNGKITINPTFDLDLANNYTLSIDTGAFLGETTEQASVAFTPISFSTVAPMDAAGGTAGTQSQTMGTDGVLAAGAYWLDLEDRSNTLGSQVLINAANKDFVFVAADYSRTTPPTSGDGDNGVATDEFFVRLYNFGIGDMIYIDTLGDNNDASLSRANLTDMRGSQTDALSGTGTRWKDINFAGILVGDGSAAGDTTGGGLGGKIRLSLEASADTPSDHTVSVTYANLPTLLGTDIGNIFAVL